MDDKNISSQETLKDRMNYYRSRNEQIIPKNSYVLIMLDGKNFSKMIKRKYKLPFDDEFINLMNDTAAYVCSKVQGARFAYVQSDEISIFMSDADSEKSTLFYDGRLVKLLSIIPAIATSYFNRHVLDAKLKDPSLTADEIRKLALEEPLYQFDAKVWTVPSLKEVLNWILYRQNDCKRNSKGQAAQTYFPHKALINKNADEQIQMLKEEKGIDWNTDYDDGKKFGRFIRKEMEPRITEVNGKTINFERSVWKTYYAKDLTKPESRDWAMENLIEAQKFEDNKTAAKETFDMLQQDTAIYCDKILKNISYMSSISETFSDCVSVEKENQLDEHYITIEKIKNEIINGQ